MRPHHELIVSGVKIPFWQMVVLFVKFSLASIPAIIILAFIASIIFGIVSKLIAIS